MIAKRIAGIVCPGNFAALAATGIVMASKRIPGSLRPFMTVTTASAFSHGAPTCSNGQSVPRPSVSVVPSK